MNERIFVDASFWIASRHPRDQRFDTARKLAAKIAKARAKLIATWFVAAETHAALTRSRKLRIQMLGDMEKNPFFALEAVTGDDQGNAVELLHAHEDKQYSLCDAISFVVMKRLGISRALTFDAHFAQIGWFQIIDSPEAF